MARSHGRIVLAFVGIVLGFFMALLDATIVNINLPEIAKTFGVGISGISWVVNAYNLAFAVAILTAARIADQFGRRKLFLIGTTTFVASSIGAALAPSVDWLIAARVFQGLAGAIMVPVTIPLAVDLVPKDKQSAVYGIWGAIAGLASAAGPALGGILTNSFGWQSIFILNVPLGIISLVLSSRLLRESRDPSAGRQLDWAGMLSISAAMFSAVYGLINAHDLGWTAPETLGLFAATLVFLISFFVVERRTKAPMLPVWMFANRRLMAASAGLFIVGLVVTGTIFLVSFWLRLSLGLSILEAGLTASIMPLFSMISSIVAGPRAARGDSRPWIIIGGFIMAAAIVTLSGLGAGSTRFDVSWRLALLGLGMGLANSPAVAAAIKAVPTEKVGMASGISMVTRSSGAVLGVAVLVSVLFGALQTEMPIAKANATYRIASDSKLLPQVRDRLTAAIREIPADGKGASTNSRPNGANEALALVDAAEHERLAAVPVAMQPAIMAKYAEQRAEVRRIFPELTTDLITGVDRAFAPAYLLAAAALALLVLAITFADGRKQPEPSTSARTGLDAGA